MITVRFYLMISALLIGSGVICGAFGAHALRDRLGPADLLIFEKGVQYQLIHGLGIGLVALIGAAQDGLLPAALRSAALLALGTVIFSGSLYLLVGLNIRWLGAITPIGGTLMIAGWLYLSWSLFS